MSHKSENLYTIDVDKYDDYGKKNIFFLNYKVCDTCQMKKIKNKKNPKSIIF